MKSAVMVLLDTVQDSYDFTNDRAALCVLLIATARHMKQGVVSLVNATMALRVLGSVVSASDKMVDSILDRISAGELVGDLTGGGRSGVQRFTSNSAVWGDFASRFFVARVSFMSLMDE